MKTINIKVGRRFRKDLRDIDAFAKPIQEIGLLHPVVINQNNELVVGARKLEACKNTLVYYFYDLVVYLIIGVVITE
jgi:ParB family transcriptional regulator, chromosome partitioning protein